MAEKQWRKSRNVIERVFIRGTLTLQTPTHFGNGDGNAATDMPLLYDPGDGRTPLLTGASIAGALRNYLREYKEGFGWKENPKQIEKSLAEYLFGYLSEWDPKEENKKRKSTVQSWLMVDDALGKFPEGASVEIRDGVAIDSKTRTAEVNERGKGQKFDIELLPAGVTFDLGFELWLTEANREPLLEGLAIALHGLQSEKINLGMRKRRGFGACKAADWQVKRYRMDNIADVVGWLDHRFDDCEPQSDIFKALFDEKIEIEPHQGTAFTMDATFRLDGSMLIRSASGDPNAPDDIHLRSWRNGVEKPVVSGTSLAGVIRHRAYRIVNTLKSRQDAEDLTDGMFGKRIKEEPSGKKEKPTGSRVLVTETEVKKVTANLVQNRVKIDRFTGGAYPGALFSQQPLFSKPESELKIKLELRKLVDTGDEQFHAEIGLLLLVLKDLWTGDLPVGGESSVGRGRLWGKRATLSLDGTEWELEESETGGLTFSGDGNPADLEKIYLAAFKKWETAND